jgi:hypothetical protein
VEEAWAELVQSGFSGETIAAITLGVMDFVADPECHRAEAWGRLGWWQSLLNGVKNIKIRAHKAVSSMAKKMEWVHGSVAKSLAYIQRVRVKLEGNAEGFDRWLRAEVEAGAKKLRKGDLRAIAAEVLECRVMDGGEGRAM